MYETLFHPPIWIPALLVLMGAVTFVIGNNRVQKQVRTIGLGLVGLAVLWFVLAWFIHTPVEQATARTKAIVAAVRGSDWTKLTTLLDRDTVVERARGAQLVTDLTQLAAEQYGLKDITVLNTDAAVLEPGDDIHVTINTLLQGAQPTTGRFEFVYERRSDGLILARITPLEVGGHSADEIRRLH